MTDWNEERKQYILEHWLQTAVFIVMIITAMIVLYKSYGG